jgi:hypothetical protein
MVIRLKLKRYCILWHLFSRVSAYTTRTELTQAAKLLNRIREVPSSNLSRHTNYTDRLSWFSSFPAIKFGVVQTDYCVVAQICSRGGGGVKGKQVIWVSSQ